MTGLDPLVIVASGRDPWRDELLRYLRAAGHRTAPASGKIELLVALAGCVGHESHLVLCDPVSAAGAEMLDLLSSLKRTSSWSAPLLIVPDDYLDPRLEEWRALPATVILDEGLDLGSLLRI